MSRPDRLLGKWLHARVTGIQSQASLLISLAAITGLAACSLLLLAMTGSLSHLVSASEEVSVSAATAGQTPAPCGAALPRLLHQQSWKSSRTACATDITVVTHLDSGQ